MVSLLLNLLGKNIKLPSQQINIMFPSMAVTYYCRPCRCAHGKQDHLITLIIDQVDLTIILVEILSIMIHKQYTPLPLSWIVYECSHITVLLITRSIELHSDFQQCPGITIHMAKKTPAHPRPYSLTILSLSSCQRGLVNGLFTLSARLLSHDCLYCSYHMIHHLSGESNIVYRLFKPAPLIGYQTMDLMMESNYQCSLILYVCCMSHILIIVFYHYKNWSQF